MFELLEKLNPLGSQDSSAEMPGLDVMRLRSLQLFRARDSILEVIPEKKKDISVVASSIAHSIASASQPTDSASSRTTAEPSINFNNPVFNNPVELAAGVNTKPAAEVAPAPDLLATSSGQLSPVAPLSSEVRSADSPTKNIVDNQLSDAQAIIASTATAAVDARARMAEVLETAV